LHQFGVESICNRVDHLSFSVPVIYQDRQMDKSITSGTHESCYWYCTARSHGSFRWRHSGLVLQRQYSNLNTQPFVPLVRAENIDGVSGLKYFVPTKPLVIVPEMHFDMNIQEDTNSVFTVDTDWDKHPVVCRNCTGKWWLTIFGWR
jgi:hypothetical protein